MLRPMTHLAEGQDRGTYCGDRGTHRHWDADAGTALRPRSVRTKSKCCNGGGWHGMYGPNLPLNM